MKHIDIVVSATDDRMPECPNCDFRKYYEGPSGGMATNIECIQCNAQWNLIIFYNPGSYRSATLPDTMMIVRLVALNNIAEQALNSEYQINRNQQKIWEAGAAIRDKRADGLLAPLRKWWTGKDYGCFICSWKDGSSFGWAGHMCRHCGTQEQLSHL